MWQHSPEHPGARAGAALLALELDTQDGVGEDHQGACLAGASLAAIEETVTAGASSLSYDVAMGGVRVAAVGTS